MKEVFTKPEKIALKNFELMIGKLTKLKASKNSVGKSEKKLFEWSKNNGKIVKLQISVNIVKKFMKII